MEPTNELKKKNEKSETKEDIKKIADDAEMILNDSELDQIAGGRLPDRPARTPDSTPIA